MTPPASPPAPIPAATPALQLDQVRKSFRRETGESVPALDGISFTLRRGGLAAVVGPDGAGKTTLIRLLAGLMQPDGGTVGVLGTNAAVDPQAIQSRIAYMPQRFGLYEDLTVRKNLDLYADMHGITAGERRGRYARLMSMTGLDPFQQRLAGQLSGGMKQKLGLACTLVGSPELLLLDEPTVGVDPLSRRELWQIIRRLIGEGLTVLLSSSDPDEAASCDQVLVLGAGKKLMDASPAAISRLALGRTFVATPPQGMRPRDLQARLLTEPAVIDALPESGQVRFVTRADMAAGGDPTAARFEDGFVVLLHQARGDTPAGPPIPTPHAPRISGSDGDTVVEVRDLERRFGGFVAVDRASFDVKRGEIFGLLGPNGAGKTTTFRMLCGLLPASGGTLQVAGVDVRHARASARQHLGYVAQKFSLYGQLTVGENLAFFARAYGLDGHHHRERIAWALQEFQLEPYLDLPSAHLPGGFKQRLAMAAALMHRPEILFLDEPTSGADPFARREFWRRITALANVGVTVIVTTHFMEEAEYCDRALILADGKVLAQGTPAQLRARAPVLPGRTATMEDAFVAIVEAARGASTPARSTSGQGARAAAPRASASGRTLERRHATLRRIAALTRKESRQVLRDPSSVAIGIVFPLMMILLFGYGLSLDVTRVTVAVVDNDASSDSRALVGAFRLSPNFVVRTTRSMHEATGLMLARKVDGILQVPSDFSRRRHAGAAGVQIVVNGTDANQARIMQAYAGGPVAAWSAAHPSAAAAAGVVVVDRLWFNEADDSHYFLVPGLIVLVMTIIGAFLTAMVVAREWERGTLEALFVTPMRPGEFLLGKFLPYFAMGMVGFALCFLAGQFLFHVPLRGSLPLLCLAAVVYLVVALGIGLLVSTLVKSQFLASQLAMLLTFLPAMMLSGFLYDLRSMPAAIRLITYALPARYAVTLLQTLYLAGDVHGVIWLNMGVLALMAAALMLATRLATRKQLS